MASNLIATEYDKQTSQVHIKMKVSWNVGVTVSLNSIVGRDRWSHLVVLLRYSLVHSHPCDRSVLDQSAQPWLDAQYTVELQSAVARSVHLLNRLEMRSRDSAHCHVVGVTLGDRGYPH